MRYKKKELYLYSLHPANVQHLGEPIHIHQVEAADWILTSEYIVYGSEGTEATRGKIWADTQQCDTKPELQQNTAFFIVC